MFSKGLTNASVSNKEEPGFQMTKAFTTKSDPKTVPAKAPTTQRSVPIPE
jgi:hypothetical protein